MYVVLSSFIDKVTRIRTEKVNFIIHYEIDDEDVKTVLRMDVYDGDDEGTWVLLEPVEPAAQA